MKKIIINDDINSFPNVRLRRLRTTGAVRELLQETRLSPKDLIAPIFVQEGLKNTQEVASMPDIHRHPLSKLVVEVDRIMELGISAIILFGLPLQKNSCASSSAQESR
jgi:porphobilinogen synthase